MIVVVGASLAAALAGCSAAPQDASQSQNDDLTIGIKPHVCPHPGEFADPGNGTAHCVAPPAVDMGLNEASAVQQLTAAGCSAPQAYQFSCGTSFFHFSRCPYYASSTVDAWVANHQSPPIYRPPPGTGLTEARGRGYVVHARYPDPSKMAGNICSACVSTAPIGYFDVLWNLDTDNNYLMPQPMGSGGGPDPGPITQCSCMSPPPW
jgi:hypothetical protein